MIISIILMLVSLLLDSITPCIIKGFIPFFSLVSILFFLTNSANYKNGLLIIFFYGMVYDFLFTDTLFLHAFLFLFLSFIFQRILKDSANFIKLLLCYYFMIALYVLLIIIFTFLYVNYEYVKLGYKIVESLLLNTSYFILIYIIFISIKCLIGNKKKTKTYS